MSVCDIDIRHNKYNSSQISLCIRFAIINRRMILFHIISMHGCDNNNKVNEFVLSISSHVDYVDSPEFVPDREEGRRDNDDERPIRTLSSCRQKMPGWLIITRYGDTFDEGIHILYLTLYLRTTVINMILYLINRPFSIYCWLYFGRHGSCHTITGRLQTKSYQSLMKPEKPQTTCAGFPKLVLH